MAAILINKLFICHKQEKLSLPNYNIKLVNKQSKEIQYSRLRLGFKFCQGVAQELV